ncbi:hypothetical protein TYRP_018624 [Tyrophagus putrescentiae]|nr:hypothetical protein TYRP_018624 [Tyrophagus putrescentiae]
MNTVSSRSRNFVTRNNSVKRIMLICWALVSLSEGATRLNSSRPPRERTKNQRKRAKLTRAMKVL